MGLIRCVGCGKFINDNSEKCKYCGCRFENSEIKPKLTKEQKRKRIIIILSILIFIAVIWIILSIVLSKKREITCTFGEQSNSAINYKITYKMEGPKIVKMIGYQYEKINDNDDRKNRFNELVRVQDNFLNEDTSTFYIKKGDNDEIILNYSLDVSENLDILKTLHRLIEIDGIEVNTKSDEIKKIYEDKGFICK